MLTLKSAPNGHSCFFALLLVFNAKGCCLILMCRCIKLKSTNPQLRCRGRASEEESTTLILQLFLFWAAQQSLTVAKFFRQKSEWWAELNQWQTVKLSWKQYWEPWGQNIQFKRLCSPSTLTPTNTQKQKGKNGGWGCSNKVKLRQLEIYWWKAICCEGRTMCSQHMSTFTVHTPRHEICFLYFLSYRSTESFCADAAEMLM